MAKEIWKDVPQYKGLYQVSNFGRFKALYKSYKCGENHAVIRTKEEHLLKFGNNRGYLTVALSKEGKARTMLAHRIIGVVFVHNPQNKPEINHINGDKKDLRATNLEWNTRSENIQHAFDNNLKKGMKLGEHGCAKIVLDTQTGIFYECAKEAAIAKGINYSTFINKLSGQFGHKNNTGLIYT